MTDTNAAPATDDIERIAFFTRAERKAAVEKLPGILKSLGVAVRDPASIVKLFGRYYTDIALVFEPPVSVTRIEKQLGRVGRYTFFGDQSTFERVSGIGRYSSLASNIIMGRAFHPTSFLSSSKVFYAGAGSTLVGDEFTEFKTLAASTRQAARAEWIRIEAERHGEISIGHDVWIGDRVIVMQGVSIGTGAVVAANAVVTKDVPPYAVVGGVPAKLIKYRFPEKTIERLLASRWWDLPLHAMAPVPSHDIDRAIDAIEEIRAKAFDEIIQSEVRILIDEESVSIVTARTRHSLPALGSTVVADNAEFTPETVAEAVSPSPTDA